MPWTDIPVINAGDEIPVSYWNVLKGNYDTLRAAYDNLASEIAIDTSADGIVTGSAADNGLSLTSITPADGRLITMVDGKVGSIAGNEGQYLEWTADGAAFADRSGAYGWSVIAFV